MNKIKNYVITIANISMLTPTDIREMVASRQISMDLLSQLPDSQFYKVFPNTLADKDGFLVSRKGVTSPVHINVIRTI